MKIIRILVLCFLLFLFTACTSSDYRDTNYFTGTKGLELEFLDGGLFLEVYEKSTFPQTIVVSNEGAFNVNSSQPGKISLTFDSFYLTTLSNADPFQVLNSPVLLNGKSYLFPEGEDKSFVLPTFQVKEVEGPREYPQTMVFVDLCYPYQTILVTEICIDTSSVTHDARSQVCSAEDLSFSSQGAPVAVNSVAVEMQPLGTVIRPVFLVSIENKGSGRVLSPVNDNQKNIGCEMQDNLRSKWNQVKISAKLTNEDLICEPEMILLRNEKGFSRCYSDNPQYSAALNYYAPLMVELDYVYSTTISRDVNIKRLIPYQQTPNPVTNCYIWQVKVGGTCINKCVFCANNPLEDVCKNTGVKKGFTCSCTDNDCITMQNLKSTDQCIFRGGIDLCQDPYFCCNVSQKQ